MTSDKNSVERSTHPLQEESLKDWYLCHPAFGVRRFDDLPFGNLKVVDATLLKGTPYARLSEAAQDQIDGDWIDRLMEWISTQGIRSVYFVGGEGKDERAILQHYAIPERQVFRWRPELAKILPSMNPRSLRLVADDVKLIAFDTWDNVYVDNVSALPEDLRRPYGPGGSST